MSRNASRRIGRCVSMCCKTPTHRANSYELELAQHIAEGDDVRDREGVEEQKREMVGDVSAGKPWLGWGKDKQINISIPGRR